MTIDHLAFAVRSIAEAERLYVAGLGLAVTHREDVPAQGARAAFLPVGDAAIELLEPLGADSPVGRFIERSGEGIHHVAFRVPDLDAALRGAAAADSPAVDPEPRPGSRGTRVAFLHPRGAHGVLIELVEYPAGRAR